MAAFEATGRDLPAEKVSELLEGGEAQIVDVREPYEYEAGHIPGVLHIELEHLAGRSGEIDKDKTVVFQCRMGRRSALATEAFAASGFQAYNLSGGIEAWVEKGLPLEPEDGTVASHGLAQTIEHTDFSGGPPGDDGDTT